MKKSMFIVLMLFGFNTVADMQSDMSMDQMSGSSQEVLEVMQDDSEADGFVGSFSLRYQPSQWASLEGADDLTYRARVGWMGEVNDQVKWGVVLSTMTEQNFSSLSVANIGFEQAYLSYSPVENLYVKVGKMGWMPNFHKAGILMSEQIYTEGLSLKYKYEMGEDSNVYVKAGAYKEDMRNAPLSNGTTLKGKLGVNFSVSDFKSNIYAMGVYDGLLMGEPAEGEAKADAKTLAQAGLNVHHSEMAVPVGVFGHYLSNVADLGKASFTAGVAVGKAGRASAVEAGDFGLAVSYYDIDAENYRTAWLNEDYVAGAGKGIAGRLQYNVWENSSLAVKYAYDMDSAAESKNNLVAELTFVF